MGLQLEDVIPLAVPSQGNDRWSAEVTMSRRRWQRRAGRVRAVSETPATGAVLTFAYSLSPFEDCEADVWSAYVAPLGVEVRARDVVTVMSATHAPPVTPTPPPTPRPCE